MIKSGDKVSIVWVNASQDHEWEQEGVTVLNMPQGPGDLIQVRLAGGIENAINPYHPDFCCLKKYPGGD